MNIIKAIRKQKSVPAVETVIVIALIIFIVGNLFK